MNTRLTKGNIQTPNKDALSVLVPRETEVKTTKSCDHTLPSETRVKKIKRQCWHALGAAGICIPNGAAIWGEVLTVSYKTRHTPTL